MTFHKILWPTVGVWITHIVGWPLLVTLSVAKGLSGWASRCFAEFTLSIANVLSMTVPSSCRAIPATPHHPTTAFDGLFLG